MSKCNGGILAIFFCMDGFFHPHCFSIWFMGKGGSKMIVFLLVGSMRFGFSVFGILNQHPWTLVWFLEK